MKKLAVFLIVAIGLSLGGCATITRGSNQTLVVESEPPGAEVELSNGLRGTTPASFKVKRKDNLVIKIKKEGYEPVEANVTSSASGGGGAAMAGNILLGGLIGAAVDGGTGAMNELKPNPVSVKLVPLGSVPANAVSGSSDSLKIIKTSIKDKTE